MDEHLLSIIVTILGGMVMLLGLGSRWMEQNPVPATLVALLLGVLVGPEVLGIIDLAKVGEEATILEKSARLALGIGLVSVALRIPKAFPRKHWKELALLVSLGMVLMWFISSLLVYLILGLPFWISVLIGAILAPTDPIAASPIVTGPVAKENLPERIKHTMSFESGANDGLSFLMVFLPILMLTKPTGEALSHWFMQTFLWEVLGATVFGVLLGLASAKLLQAAEKRELIQENWRLVYTVALALLAIGAGKLINSDEVLVVFAAGAAFVQIVGEEDRGEEEHGQEAVNRFFSIPIFALLGTAIPWAGWAELGWKGIFLAIAVLLFRRPPVLLLLQPLLPSLKTKKDALFLGWFGPIAVAAIYYGSLAEHKLLNPVIWDVVSLVICVSVLMHGTTATPLSRWYGRATGQKFRQQETGKNEA